MTPLLLIGALLAIDIFIWRRCTSYAKRQTSLLARCSVRACAIAFIFSPGIIAGHGGVLPAPAIAALLVQPTGMTALNIISILVTFGIGLALMAAIDKG